MIYINKLNYPPQCFYLSIFIHTTNVRFEFVLHDTYASFPRKLTHEPHKHTRTDEEHGYNFGFKNVCSKSCDVQIDVRCTSFRERRSSMKAIHSISYSLPPQKPGTVYWCEACERKVNPSTRFYTCEDCSSTLHIKCVVTKSQLFLMFLHLGRIVICASPVAKTQQVSY
ncbi:hypothetical protein HID58_059231, partial [Brassica napus]